MALLSEVQIKEIKAGHVKKGEIFGTKQVLLNLKKVWKSMEGGTSRGLRIAGLLLQRESMLLVPVDYGILKASAFTRATGLGYKTVVNVGYTAAYAIHVHENVEMKGKGQPRQAPHKGFYWDPQGRGQSKFLEEPFRRFLPTLLKTVKASIVQ